MPPEIYILRIYRRTGDRSREIAGRVETPSGKRCAGFAGLGELCAILESPNAHLRRADDLKSAEDAQLIQVHREEDRDEQQE
jgi:hypothetical protein